MTESRVFRGISGAFAALLIVAFLAPFCYVLLSSFWTEKGVNFMPYYDVFWAQSQYMLRFWRSLGICLCVGLGQLFVSVMAGFGFSKCRFPGRNAIFFGLMILMVLPVQVTLVPNYIMMGKMGLLDSYLALILPLIFAPLGAFILRQSFASIPNSIIDAAMLDGCGIPRIILEVAVPMNVSGLVCAFLLSFLDAWNMVEQPIAYLRDFTHYPLSVALAYVPPENVSIHLVCCILVVLPCFLLFAFFNQELVEGITLAEVK